MNNEKKIYIFMDNEKKKKMIQLSSKDWMLKQIQKEVGTVL